MASLITKAVRTAVGTYLPSSEVPVPKRSSRGSIGSYIIGAPPEYGQPRPDAGGTALSALIPPERMREIVMRTPTASAAMNAVLDFASSVLVKIRNIDPSKPPSPAAYNLLTDYLTSPNPNDTFLHFRKMVYRDIITMGWGAVEIERGDDGGIANLWPLDAAKLWIDFDEHGNVLGYDMMDARGMPIHGEDGVHAWEPQDVILFRLDPVTFSRYPTSRILQLFACAVVEDLMMQFIGSRFTESNIPFGVMDLGDMTEQELEVAISSWNSQASKQHRILLTGSKGNGAKYFSFGYHLKDLEAKDLLAMVRGQIMAIMGVTMNELGESQDVNKSNGYNLSYTFKKRAVEPLLNEFCETMTKRFIREGLGLRDVEFSYDEIDSRDELLQAQIDEAYLKHGILTVNQVRKRRGDPAVFGGDEPLLETNAGMIPVSQVKQFADAQLAGLLAVVAETNVMIEQAKAEGQTGDGASPKVKLPQLVSAPLIRPPQSPEKMHTPLGSGSSTTKIKYPRASDLKEKAPPGSQKPRGTVQAARNAGMRKEDMQ